MFPHEASAKVLPASPWATVRSVRGTRSWILCSVETKVSQGEVHCRTVALSLQEGPGGRNMYNDRIGMECVPPTLYRPTKRTQGDGKTTINVTSTVF